MDSIKTISGKLAVVFKIMTILLRQTYYNEAREIYAAAQAAGTEISSRWSGTIKDGNEQFKKDAGQKIK